MMLLTWMPVPGTTIPEPSPFVHVTAQARPAPSITEMCVVDPSRDPSEPRKSSAKPCSARPSRNSGVRSSCASCIAATIAASDGGPAVRFRRPSASASRMPPADGGGFVKTSRPR